MFDDITKLEAQIRNYKADDKKRLALEYLNGNKVRNIYRPMPMMARREGIMRKGMRAREDQPEMEMAAMAAPPPGARFDAMPAVAMAAAPAGGKRNKAAVMEDADMGGAYSKAAAAPSDKKEAIVLNEDVNQDFQKVKIGSRDYSHTLRPGWNKLGSRIDFTQTLLFNSAQKLLPTQECLEH